MTQLIIRVEKFENYTISSITHLLDLPQSTLKNTNSFDENNMNDVVNKGFICRYNKRDRRLVALCQVSQVYCQLEL